MDRYAYTGHNLEYEKGFSLDGFLSFVFLSGPRVSFLLRVNATTKRLLCFSYLFLFLSFFFFSISISLCLSIHSLYTTRNQEDKTSERGRANMTVI
jgi:hypothetical protein